MMGMVVNNKEIQKEAIKRTLKSFGIILGTLSYVMTSVHLSLLYDNPLPLLIMIGLPIISVFVWAIYQNNLTDIEDELIIKKRKIGK